MGVSVFFLSLVGTALVYDFDDLHIHPCIVQCLKPRNLHIAELVVLALHLDEFTSGKAGASAQVIRASQRGARWRPEEQIRNAPPGPCSEFFAKHAADRRETGRAKALHSHPLIASENDNQGSLIRMRQAIDSIPCASGQGIHFHFLFFFKKRDSAGDVLLRKKSTEIKIMAIILAADQLQQCPNNQGNTFNAFK